MGLKEYLDKSQDTLEEFQNDPGMFTDLDVEVLDWLDFKIYDDIFWIRTLHGKQNSIKDVQSTWESIKDFAKQNGCTKIQFTTKRDGKVWERYLKDAKVIQWKLEVKL